MKKIALLGFGVVGSGVASVLTAQKNKIETLVGDSVEIAYILDLRQFPDSPFGKLVTPDFSDILNDESVSLVAEMMGGTHPAYDYTKACLEKGKSVVTSNKAVVAEYGPELLELAEKNHCFYRFEASVGGGIPLLSPVATDMGADDILSVNGILNGTTNYILTQMKECGASFDDALAEAQAKGFAEKDPTADVDGWDSARKICILTAIVTRNLPSFEEISVKGIRNVKCEATSLAEQYHGSVKLIAHMDRNDGEISVCVSPFFVPATNLLASVNGVMNGVMVHGKNTGDVMFYGAGAGSIPTASAVTADIVAVLSNRQYPSMVWKKAKNCSQPALSYLLQLPGCEKCLAKAEKEFAVSGKMEENGFSFITNRMTEEELARHLATLGKEPIVLLPVLN